MKASIRDLLWLTVVVAVSVGWWVHYRSLTQRGLYADGEVDALVVERCVYFEGSRKYLVLANGTTMSRKKVFQTLGIDERRLRDFRSYAADGTCTLSWQISPRYDLACMTELYDPSGQGLTVGDERRLVYDIEILERDP